MAYHVLIWPASSEQQKHHELYAMNLSEDDLRARFVEPYDYGRPITWNGRTLPGGDISYINIHKSPGEISYPRHGEYDAIKQFPEVTNEFIHGGPGHAAAGEGTAGATYVGDPRAASAASVSQSDDRREPKRVMVVHGRNLRVRDAMFTFLRALGLRPIEWDDAVEATKHGTPHNFTAVRAAMEIGQAVVVILTAEDRAGILPELAGSENDGDLALRGQPRQNVAIEAGLAMGIDERRTILVEVGEIRRASDFAGMNTVRLNNRPDTRTALRRRLATAGCEVDDGADYLGTGAGGDFEATIIDWAAEPATATGAGAAQLDDNSILIVPGWMAAAGEGKAEYSVELRNQSQAPARDVYLTAHIDGKEVGRTEPRDVYPPDPVLYQVVITSAVSLDHLPSVVSFIATDRDGRQWRHDA